MWDIRDIGQPWAIAIETGMLELTSTKVRPGPASAVFDSEDPIAQVNLGRAIVNVSLQHAMSRSPLVNFHSLRDAGPPGLQQLFYATFSSP